METEAAFLKEAIIDGDTPEYIAAVQLLIKRGRALLKMRDLVNWGYQDTHYYGDVHMACFCDATVKVVYCSLSS